MTDQADPKQTSRRDLLLGATALGLAGTALSGATQPARAAMGKGADEHNIRPDGTYATMPLRSDTIRLGVVQSRVRPVDIDNLRRTRRDNLEHMIKLIDAANNFGGRQDILQFHEFPLTGFDGKWGRAEALRAAIDIPGPETEAIGEKAKEYNSYIVFGSYAKDEDWPDHLLSITTIIGPDGSIVDKHWKARNIKGVFGGFELFTTTIYDVLDQYIEMYGLDQVVPITRTDVGNLATTSTQREPEVIRAFAIKGAEIVLRTATGGFTPLDIEAGSLYNRVYSTVANNAISPGLLEFGFAEYAGGGGSAIYGPDGQPVDIVNSQFEEIIRANIPMASYRARHRQPYVHMELHRPVFNAYVEPFAPNLFADYLPTDGQDSARFLADKSRWK